MIYMTKINEKIENLQINQAKFIQKLNDYINNNQIIINRFDKKFNSIDIEYKKLLVKVVSIATALNIISIVLFKFIV